MTTDNKIAIYINDSGRVDVAHPPFKRGINMEKIRSENWTITLYPNENTDDLKIKEYIIKNFEYAYIKHDKDIDKETGEIKKIHEHIIITMNNARTLESISKELNIESNRIEKVRNLRKMVRYLIHMDNKEKWQYEKEDVESNMWDKIEKYFLDSNGSETYEIERILEYIYSVDRYIYYHEVLEFALYNNMYASFRRGTNIMTKIIEEHNKLFLEKKESEKTKKEQIKKEIAKWELESGDIKKKAKKSIAE